MTASQSQRRVGRIVTAISTAGAVLSALAAGAPAAGAASTRHHAVPAGQAVVALRGTSAVRVPGVTVDAVLSSIHSELVHGSAAALRQLAAAPGVLGVSADRKVQPTSYTSAVSGASLFSWQGMGTEAGRSGAGAGAHIALIDTGVADTAGLSRSSGHLVDAIDTSPVVTGAAPLTSGVFSDGYGHGTFMASLIASGAPATRHRTVGIAPGAVVDVVKVAGDDGVSSFGSMMYGLNWVAVHASSEAVANISFGLTPDAVGGYGQDPLNLATETLRFLGTNVVVSAGNTAGQVTDPGFDPRVITVGAADTRGWRPKVASFSGSAQIAGVNKPDLVAPGVGILGTLPPSSSIALSHPTALQPNGFYRGSGTSEATAIVTGLAALFVADNPGVTTAQVKASLRVSADPFFAKGSGAGLAGVVRHVVRPRDEWRLLGDGGALGEATFDGNSWASNGWGTASWGSNGWGSNGWGSNGWGSNGWGSAGWGSNGWGSNGWGSNGWGSNGWGSNGWGSNGWGSNGWGSNGWGSNGWGSNGWGSNGWGSESWGNEGGGGS